jgi:hypothetical protein
MVRIPLIICRGPLPRSLIASPVGLAPHNNLPPCGRALPLLYVNDMIMTGDDPKYIAFLRSV